MTFRDVHIYDGKLIGLFEPRFSTLPLQEKNTLFENIRLKLTSQRSKEMFDLIIQDDAANYSHENQMNATDILIDLLQHDDVNNILQILIEQLEDIINLGICPSGRVTRLFQVWSSLKK